MAWDSSRSLLVLLGGDDSGTGLALTWNGNDWTTVTAPSDTNEFRSNAYDPIRAETVAFGGDDGFGANNNHTWVCGASGVWTQRSPTHAPSARCGSYMAWCNTLSAVVLFGGIDDTNTLLADTWKWTGTDWTQLFPATSPSARWGGNPPNKACQYGNDVMIFNDDAVAQETWMFNGTTWANQSPATTPNVFGSAIAWNPVRQKVLMLGTPFSGSDMLTYSWALGAANWTAETPTASPSKTNLWQTIEYDGNLGKFLMFGARSAGGFTGPETWVFDEPADASIRHTFGLG